MWLFSVALHHGEAGDPELMDWIKHRLDELIGLEPEVVAALLGLLVVAIPAVILLFYAWQRRKVSPPS